MQKMTQACLGIVAITHACLALGELNMHSGNLHNSELVLDSLCCLNNGLLSEVGSPLMSLTALYIY